MHVLLLVGYIPAFGFFGLKNAILGPLPKESCTNSSFGYAIYMFTRNSYQICHWGVLLKHVLQYLLKSE
jgi:hypothetical protein